MTSTSIVQHQHTALSPTSSESFEVVTKQAALLAKSTIIPTDYRDKPANVLVAMEYAHRLGASVLAVMQNLDIVHGRPSLRASFLIGTVNASGRFTPIRYRWQGEPGTDGWGCRAWAVDKATREECVGPLITIKLAKDEGWYGKNGSKWKTIPELMLTYRAGAWWTRIYCPDLALGLHTTEEVEEMPAPTREHAASVLEALHSADADATSASLGPVVDAVVETDGEEPDTDVPPAGCEELHAKYLGALAERGMGDEDRAAFQQRLHGSGLVQAEEWSGWVKQDYRSALAELQEIPVAEEVGS